MDIELIIYLELGAIGILIVALLIARSKIKRLQALLEEEKKKRTFPLLVFSINRDELKAYLKNESYCYAKHVQIDDIDLTVDYGYKKTLKLRFDPILMLKPNQIQSFEFFVYYPLPEWGGKKLLIEFEQNVILTENGIELFIPQIEKINLIR